MNTEDILRAYLVINAYLSGSLSSEEVLKVVKRLSKRMACDWMKYYFLLSKKWSTNLSGKSYSRDK